MNILFNREALFCNGAFFIKKILVTAILLMFASGFSYSQKILQKEFSSENIKKLVIEDDMVFSIKVMSKPSKNIKVLVHISGENSESIMLKEEVSNNELKISTGYSPFFTEINDKLAAHKVISIEMEVEVPYNLELDIQSKLASVKAIGSFKEVKIALNEGNCNLLKFNGKALIQTKIGDITVETTKKVGGSAISKNGFVKNELAAKGEKQIIAESLFGNISLMVEKE